MSALFEPLRVGALTLAARAVGAHSNASSSHESHKPCTTSKCSAARR